MDYKLIIYQLDQGVAKIKFNRPDVLNSFNQEMAKEVQKAIASAKEDSNVRSVLIAAEGRAFCAGQDLAEVVSKDGAFLGDLSQIVKESYNPIIRVIRNLEKPVVCAVNGIAAGAGANIAFACDIVVAASDASFIQAFSKIGLIPDSGGTFFLPRLVGLPRAAAMTMLGEKITAAKALEIGMIYKVCEPAALYEEAYKIAKYLAEQPTVGLGLTKRGLNQSLANNLDQQLDFEATLQSLAGKTEDYKEGVKAFLEKRKPIFKGR